jgi:hypothetical protein
MSGDVTAVMLGGAGPPGPPPAYGTLAEEPTGSDKGLYVRTDDGDGGASTGLWQKQRGAYVRVGPPAKHASQHASGGSDPVTPASIGAATTGQTAAAQAAAEAASIPLAQKGAHNGVATLDGTGLLPSAQLPPLALTDPHVVHSEAEQLALVAHEGTFAIRTDIGKTYVQNGGTAGTMADWTELVTPGDVTSVNGHVGTVVLGHADVGADVEGAAASETARAEAAEAAISLALQSARVFYINVKDHGAAGNGVTDDTAAIEAAQKYAEEQPGNYGVFFGAGAYLYSETLRIKVPWKGVPRKSILKRTSTFTYAGFNNQFSVINQHFAAVYNPETADQVKIEGVDFEIESDNAVKSGLGLANVAAGELNDVHIKTNGTIECNGPLYIYACARNIVGDRVVVENLTGAAHGGALFIQALTTESAAAANNTEGIRFRNSSFINNSGDEAVAIYGAHGKTRDVRLDDCLLEGLEAESKQGHQAILSVFPLSNKGEHANAAVEDVVIENCTIIDTTGMCEGDMIRVGASEDAEAGKEAICQNVRIVSPSIYAKTAKVANTQSIMRNVPCKFEGPFSGCKVISPYINAKGSPQSWDFAFKGWSDVVSPSVDGNIVIGVNECLRVLGGEIECASRGIYNCGKVSGTQFKLSTEGGTAIFGDNATNTYQSISDCTFVGGGKLLFTNAGAHLARIDIRGCEMTPAAANAVLVETPTAAGEAPTRLRVLNCTVLGTTTKTRAEYLLGNASQSEYTGNELFGEAELVTTARIAEEAVTEPKLANLAVTAGKLGEEAVGTIKIKNEAVNTEKLAALAVTTAKIAEEAVTSAKIKNEAVTAAKIGPEAVETNKIKAEAVTGGKIAKETITSEKYAPGSVNSAALAAGSVLEGKLGAEAVTTEKLKGLAVTEAKIAGEAVTAAKLGPEAVTSAKIKKEAVTAEKLGPEAVETNNIKKEAVLEGKLGPEAVVESKIKNKAVSAAKLAAPLAKPAKPAEKGVEAQTEPHPARRISFAITGDGAKTAWKVTHGLGTRLIQAVVQKAEGEEPGELEPAANVKCKPTSGTEAEVTLTAAPGAGVLMFITVEG